tara:strand:- start:3136 stop:3570 length:435 start_codon:yes stop_codon:yes gene_type:complete
MATSGIVNGTKFEILIGPFNEVVAYGTSCSLSISNNYRNTTNAISNGWNTRMLGDRDWEMTADGFVLMSVTGSRVSIFDMFTEYIEARKIVLVRFMTTGSGVSGDKYFSGNAILTAISVDAPNQQSTTYSASFIAAGELSITTQ